MKHEVVTLGEAMAVIYPSSSLSLEQADTLTLGIGGAESNLAITLSHLGHRVRFISRVGNDPFGQRIRAVLEAEEVDTSALLTDQTAPTGVFFREWLPDGKRRVFYYRANSAASRLSPTDLSPEVFAGVRLLHLTGITPALSASCAAAVERAIELAHAAHAVVSFDPNYRAALWTPASARKALLPLMARVDILLMGHEDCSAILGIDDVESALHYGRSLGVQIIVLKEAERGATGQIGETRVSVPAEPVAATIDPVGAGDAFDAGFLSGWLRGNTLGESLRLGAQMGAASVATLGDYVPLPGGRGLFF